MRTSKIIEHKYDALFAEYERAKYPILAAPFHGAPVPVMLRELTHAQIMSCGNFSLIETFADKVAKKTGKYSMKEILAYSERNHELAKVALVHPTYDEIVSIFGKDPKMLEAKKSLGDMREKLAQTPQGFERKVLEDRIDALRIWVDMILPEDFLGFVVAYSLGIEKSDIKLVSEEMLIDAAILAEKGHDNPADHIGGAFTDFMRDDINARAWILLTEKRERDGRHGS